MNTNLSLYLSDQQAFLGVGQFNGIIRVQHFPTRTEIVTNLTLLVKFEDFVKEPI